MKIVVPVFLLFLLLTGCQDEASKLALTEKSYTSASLPQCKEDICPKINIQLMQAKGDSPLSTTINNAVEKVMAATLSMSPDEQSKIKTIDDGIANFITAYRQSKSEFPDLAETYEITSTSSVSHDSNTLLSLEMETYSYWGGAHGYGSTTYLNFDKETGEQLDTKHLIKDEQKFKAMAEKMFRKQQDIPSKGNINETGYFFENDSFSLPENIGFEGDELVLIYNPYEVAAYAEGQIIIKIPKAEAGPFLSVRL